MQFHNRRPQVPQRMGGGKTSVEGNIGMREERRRKRGRGGEGERWGRGGDPYRHGPKGRNERAEEDDSKRKKNTRRRGLSEERLTREPTVEVSQKLTPNPEFDFWRHNSNSQIRNGGQTEWCRARVSYWAPSHPTEVAIFISGLFRILGQLGGSEGLRVWGLEGFFF